MALAGAVRSVPMMLPMTSAISHAERATASVQPRPVISQSR